MSKSLTLCTQIALMSVATLACGASHTSPNAAKNDASVSSLSDAGAGPACGSMPHLLVKAAALVPDAGAARLSAHVQALAVNDTDLFFLEQSSAVGHGDGQLMRVSLLGGTPVSIATTSDRVETSNRQPFALSARGVVLASTAANSSEPVLVLVPLLGGKARVLTPTTGFAGPIIADDDYAYYVDRDGTKRVRLSDGEARTLSDAKPDGLEIVGSQLWLSYELKRVDTMAIDGGPVTTLLNQAGLLRPISCGGNICWLDDVSAMDVSVRETSPDGVTHTLLPGLSEPGALLFDGRALFVGGHFGDLTRVDLATPASDVRDVAGVSDIAANAACIYWYGLTGIATAARAVADEDDAGILIDPIE